MQVTATLDTMLGQVERGKLCAPLADPLKAARVLRAQHRRIVAHAQPPQLGLARLAQHGAERAYHQLGVVAAPLLLEPCLVRGVRGDLGGGPAEQRRLVEVYALDRVPDELRHASEALADQLEAREVAVAEAREYVDEQLGGQVLEHARRRGADHRVQLASGD